MPFLSSRTALVALLFGAGLLLPQAKAAEPWTDKQLKDPAALARVLNLPVHLNSDWVDKGSPMEDER